MPKLPRKIALSLLMAALAGTAAPVLAASDGGPFAREITARQSLMRLYTFNIGTLVAMAKGEMAYDAGTAGAAAANLASLAALNQQGMWPEGSDSFDNDGTRALPEIWDDLAGFEAKRKGLAEAAAAYADQAGAGLDALRAGLGAVGGACGACHKAFRKPE